MQVNMPVTTEQFANVANATMTKSHTTARDKTNSFEKVLNNFQSIKEVCNSYKTDGISNEKVDTDLEKEVKSMLESEDTTLEELVLILINMYINNHELSKVDENNVGNSNISFNDIENNLLQNLSPLEFESANNMNKPENNVLETVKNLLFTDKLVDTNKILENKLPSEIVDILQQYVSLNTEKSEFVLQDSNTYSSNNGVNIGQAIFSQEKALKERIVDQINSLLKLSNSNEQVEKPDVEPIALAMEELIPFKSINDKAEATKATVEAKEKNSLKGYELKSNTNNVTLTNQEKSSTNNSSLIEKEDAFLKDMLKDGQKGQGKINLFMNYLRGDMNVQNPIQAQSEVVVNKTTFVNDIIKTVKFMQNANLKELKVSINPKEIGELLITVTMESGKMKANIEANSKESYNLLMSHLDDIKKAIGNNEISLQDINVSINQGDTTFFKDSSQRQDRQNQSSDTGIRVSRLSLEEDLDISEGQESLNDSQINMLA